MPKLYTKFGDKGMTSLYDGSTVLKTNHLIEILGTFDELSSHIGLLCVYTKGKYVEDVTIFLRDIQLTLIDISSNIATPNKTNSKVPEITLEDISKIEKEIDEVSSQTSSLTEFLITGTSLADAQCNICREITRRVERQLWINKPSEIILIYMNRLSDYFFGLSRLLCPEEIRVSELRKQIISR